MGETKEFNVRDRVMIYAPEEEIHGLVGDVIGKRKTMIGYLYEVDFNRDISQFISLDSYQTVMCLFPSILVEHDKDEIPANLQASDYNALIDMALTIKDEYWFHELIARKQHSTADRIF